MDNNKITTFSPRKEIKGIIILLHGVNLIPKRMDELASKLAENGFKVILPTLSGHSRDSKKRNRIKPATWINDMLAFYQMANNEANRNRLPLFFIGFSMGALINLSMLDESVGKKAFDKMCLISPALALPKKGWLINLLRPIKRLPLPVPFGKYYMVKNTIPAIFLTNILEMIKKLNRNGFQGSSIPTLVILDKQDKAINPKTVRAIPAKFRLKNWSFIDVEATNRYHHLVTDERSLGKEQWEMMINSITTFFTIETTEKSKTK